MLNKSSRLALAVVLAATTASAAQKQASKPRPAKPAAGLEQGGAMKLDDWFSYGAPKEAEVEREAPGVQLKVHDPQEDEIIVYGKRFRRDFESAGDTPNLTSPQALDAAQPLVPGIGDACSYKYGCFDRDQTPLRSSLGRLLGGD